MFLAASTSLILNTAARFWGGGVASAGTLVIVAQSLLTVVAGKGALTDSGREGWERFLKQRNIPEEIWQQRSCAAAGGVLLIVGGLHAALPWFATGYNHWGWQHFEARRLGSAQQDFRTALALRPDYGAARYHLGLVYEDLQEAERAKAEYQFVVASDPDQVPLDVWLGAHNNLARLHILSDKYDQASPLLIQAMDGIDLERAKTERDIADVNYNVLKNLGWVRLRQSRYGEATDELERAIEFDRDVLQTVFADDDNIEKNRAAAHCLLAQVHDAQEARELADAEWARCTRNANRGNPDEDVWLGVYEQRQREALTE